MSKYSKFLLTLIGATSLFSSVIIQPIKAMKKNDELEFLSPYKKKVTFSEPLTEHAFLFKGNLPKQLSQHFLRFLSLADLVNCMKVNKNSYLLVTEELVMVVALRMSEEEFVQSKNKFSLLEKDKLLFSNKRFQFVEKLAFFRNTYAMRHLAMMYNTGFGVERDPVKAVRLFKEGIKFGDDEAKFQLMLAYYSGDGIKKNYTQQTPYW